MHQKHYPLIAPWASNQEVRQNARQRHQDESVDYRLQYLIRWPAKAIWRESQRYLFRNLSDTPKYFGTRSEIPTIVVLEDDVRLPCQDSRELGDRINHERYGKKIGPKALHRPSDRSCFKLQDCPIAFILQRYTTEKCDWANPAVFLLLFKSRTETIAACIAI